MWYSQSEGKGSLQAVIFLPSAEGLLDKSADYVLAHEERSELNDEWLRRA